MSQSIVQGSPVTQTAPDLFDAGIEALLLNAKRLGLTWNLRMAEVASTGASGITATYDGDSEPIGMTSMIGAVVLGARVYAIQVPPSGNFILGAAPSSAPARGVLAYGRRTTDVSSVTAETGILRLDEIPLTLGRWYKVEAQASFDNITDRTIHVLRYEINGSQATTSSTVLEEAIFNTVGVGSTGGTGRVVGFYVPADRGETFSVLYSIASGTSATVFGTNTEHCDLAVYDMGPDPGNTGVEV